MDPTTAEGRLRPQDESTVRVNIGRTFFAWLKEGLVRTNIWLTVGSRFLTPIIILSVLMIGLCRLEQGVDVTRMCIEAPDPDRDHGMLDMTMRKTSMAFCALVFLAYLTWYLSRLMCYVHDRDMRKVPLLRQHLPRALGFACFNVVVVSILRTRYTEDLGPSAATGLFVLLSTAGYALAHKAIGLFTHGRRERTATHQRQEDGRLARIFARITAGVRRLRKRFATPRGVRFALLMLGCLQVVILLISGFLHADDHLAGSATDAPGERTAVVWGALLCLLACQAIFLLVIERRRHWMEQMAGDGLVPKRFRKWRLVKAMNAFFQPIQQEYQRNRYTGSEPADRVEHEVPTIHIEREIGFFAMFNLLGLLLLLVALSAMFSTAFAVRLGPLAVALLGLSVILGFLMLCGLYRAVRQVNLLVIILAVALVTGSFSDPHMITTLERPVSDHRRYDQRMNLKEYLRHWMATHQKHLSDTSVKHYPMVFVLADGGASRSGYWVASVLGELADHTDAEFREHIFALSGASGGSVGTGVYLAIDHALHNGAGSGPRPVTGYSATGQDVLKHDLLSPTLAGLLGADMVNFALPFVGLPDRAWSLERAFEMADDSTLITGVLSRPFSDFIIAKGDLPQLGRPIICINTTRMQDGRPAVVSNIDMSQPYYNRRVDVLDLLPADRDIALSTAIILGARFPYISPAGRLHSRHGEHYFVDGGYFDNSGSGIVHEMIAAIFSTGRLLDSLRLEGSADSAQLAKLEPYVIHIGNSRLIDPEPGLVSPFANDLAAPVKTMLGAYGMQTDVNDDRLRSFLSRWGQSRSAVLHEDTLYERYIEVQLYRPEALHESYSMSWAMSRFTIDKIKRRLADHPELHQLKVWMNDDFSRAQWPEKLMR